MSYPAYVCIECMARRGLRLTEFPGKGRWLIGGCGLCSLTRRVCHVEFYGYPELRGERASSTFIHGLTVGRLETPEGVQVTYSGANRHGPFQYTVNELKPGLDR